MRHEWRREAVSSTGLLEQDLTPFLRDPISARGEL